MVVGDYETWARRISYRGKNLAVEVETRGGRIQSVAHHSQVGRCQGHHERCRRQGCCLLSTLPVDDLSGFADCQVAGGIRSGNDESKVRLRMWLMTHSRMPNSNDGRWGGGDPAGAFHASTGKNATTECFNWGKDRTEAERNALSNKHCEYHRGTIGTMMG